MLAAGVVGETWDEVAAGRRIYGISRLSLLIMRMVLKWAVDWR